MSSRIITNNPKYILPGSNVYTLKYSNMLINPGEDGFKNPNTFIDNRGRCFAKAWLGDTSLVFDNPTPVIPESCSSCKK